MDKNSVDYIIQKQKVKIIGGNPFFATLLFSLKFVETDTIPTMATDGDSLFYNPEFTKSITPAQVQGVIIHELLHCAFFHHTRKKPHYDHEKWNIACDYAINPIILNNHFELPPGALKDAIYEGKTAEQIYEMLPENYKDKLPKNYQDFGSVIQNRKEKKGQEAKWKGAVVAANNKAKGDVSNDLKLLVEKLNKPKIDWAAALRKFLQENSKGHDFTWNRPNKNYTPMDIYVPSIQNISAMQAKPIAIGIDTSGSISNQELKQFISELKSIVEDLVPEKVTVIFCDCEVSDTFDFEDGDFDLKDLKITGGGGTEFTPVFDWIEKSTVDYSCCVYFTDMESNFPKSLCVPTLWVATTDRKAPVGDTVRLSINDKKDDW